MGQNAGMDVNSPLALLGGLSPAAFMRLHWQKKPLLVRQAWPGIQPPATRAALFQLAGQDDVESRLVVRNADEWLVRHGPMPRRVLPPLAQPGWTLLVQGLDLHLDDARALLDPFRFLPEARFDDLMVSWASDGGGVGPHVDAYDVFLLQVAGRRRWRVAKPADNAFVEGLPLRILQHFEPCFDWVLEPGDMLYLPPRWAHDGVAVGECMTYSIGFRQPARGELARELLQRLAEDAEDAAGDAVYRDPGQPAVESPGGIPPGMMDFARDALQAVLNDPVELQCLLGEYLSEPKANVWFEAESEGTGRTVTGAVALDRRTRMMFDEQHIFINGESYRASGRDAQLMRRLADERCLAAGEVARASQGARQLLTDWRDAGWLHDKQ